MTKPGKLPKECFGISSGSGKPIGVIVAKIWYPALIRGHHNYCSTYDFPIRIKLIENWVCLPKEEQQLPQWEVSEFIRCAKELEKEGVAAITTYCGMTGSIQNDLTESVNIPVFTSNLLMVPFISRIIGKNKRIGILSASSDMILRDNGKALRDCGIDSTIPIAIKGMVESEYSETWRTQYCLNPEEEIDKHQYDPVKVEQMIVKVTKQLLSEFSDVGAVVLECTEMPIYAKALQNATGLPVFDSSDMVRYVHSAFQKDKYY